MLPYLLKILKNESDSIYKQRASKRNIKATVRNVQWRFSYDQRAAYVYDTTILFIHLY